MILLLRKQLLRETAANKRVYTQTAEFLRALFAICEKSGEMQCIGPGLSANGKFRHIFDGIIIVTATNSTPTAAISAKCIVVRRVSLLKGH